MQTQLDFLIENIEVKKDMSNVFITVDPMYKRIRFSKGCGNKLKGFKQGEHFVIGYREADKTLLIPKLIPATVKPFKVGASNYTSIPQLFEKNPFKAMKTTTKFKYQGCKDGYHVFRKEEQHGSSIFYV